MNTVTTTSNLDGLPASFLSSPNRMILLSKAIDLALEEDLGDTNVDLTSDAVIDAHQTSKAIIYCLSKEAVIAGLPILEPVFRRLDPEIIVNPLIAEGSKITQTKTAIAHISGNTRTILKGERVVLNLLQRMCAIATITAQFVEKAKKFGIAILDTRKTTPGLRAFEKYAVLVAGGNNHRFGLNDAILVKDNHIKATGSIGKAVGLLRNKYGNAPLQVECESLDQVKESLSLKIEKIMLDNMSPAVVKEAVDLIKGQAFTEVSGGINIDTVDQYLISGVNAISIGAITHSVPSIDINLEFEE